MITAPSSQSPAALRTRSMHELGLLAKRVRVDHWRSLSKEKLVQALIRALKKTASSQRSGLPIAKTTPPKSTTKRVSSAKPVSKKKPASRNQEASAKRSAPTRGASPSKVRTSERPTSERPTNRVKGSAKAPVNVNKAPGNKAPGNKAPVNKAPLNKARSQRIESSQARPAKATAKPTTASKTLLRAATKAPPLAARKATATSPVKADLKADLKATAKPVPARKVPPRAMRRIKALHEKRDVQMDLSQTNGRGGHAKNGRGADRDRVVLLVRDSYWLQACWDLTRPSIDRARAAMAEAWHTSRPVLRVIEVDSGATTSSAERVVRDIGIHGGVRNWYIDVSNPPHGFRVEIGYLSTGGRFYSLARSNAVTTPVPGAADGLDGHWTDVAQDYERIYALSGGYADDRAAGELQELFEERLRRPMGSPAATRYGGGAERVLNRQRDFEFEVDAEMIIFGRTKPGAHVTLGGEPVKLRDDGAFAVRLGLPDRRQVLPIVASTPDGIEQRTIVLAVERNTKVMEPVVRESTE